MLDGAAWVTYVRSTYAHARIVDIDTEEAVPAAGRAGRVHQRRPRASPASPTRSPCCPTACDGRCWPPTSCGSRASPSRPWWPRTGTWPPTPPSSWWWTTTPSRRWSTRRRRPTDEVLLFPEVGTNAALRLKSAQRADFSGCEVVVSLRVENQRMTAAPIEPRSGAAYWTDDGRLVHYSACQGAHPARDALCSVYDLPPEQIRVIVPDVGRRLRSQVPLPGGRDDARLVRPPPRPADALDRDPLGEHGGHAPRAGAAPAPHHRRHA